MAQSTVDGSKSSGAAGVNGAASQRSARLQAVARSASPSATAGKTRAGNVGARDAASAPAPRTPAVTKRSSKGLPLDRRFTTRGEDPLDAVSLVPIGRQSFVAPK